MFRLTVVSGPNAGTSFTLREGENSIGRQSNNAVVLSSGQVSKRHCVLVASNGQILVRDEGSSNGTFVNGALVKSRSLKSGDRIGVGEFVLELTQPTPSRSQALELDRSAFAGNNVVPISQGSRRMPAPQGMVGFDMGTAAGAPVAGAGDAGMGSLVDHGPPKDLKGRAIWAFENYVMPIFYGFNLKHEWKWICVAVFGLFLAANLVITVQPLLDANTEIILKESARRARFMAQEIAERNAPILATGAEGKTEIGLAEKADGVRVALLMDLDQRVIAPASKMNQYMVQGREARYANEVAAAFRTGRETGVSNAFGDVVVAIEPVKVYNPKFAKNTTVGMALVAIDTSIAVLGMGEVGTVYSQTFILTAILGLLMLVILYRLTLKPLQVLNEDMDKALKGDLPQVTHEFKIEELDALWDLINSALQRIPRAGESRGAGGGGDLGEDVSPPDLYVGPLKMLAEAMGVGLVVCGADRKIGFINSVFEELSGIRSDSAIGQDIAAVARDQSLGVLTQDLFDRCSGGGDVSEEYDFSGISCTVRAAAFTSQMDPTPKAYVMAVIRKSE